MEESATIPLTQLSHGGGCGCKIAPAVLERILKNNFSFPDHKNLLVGNSSKDDAAVYDLGNGNALISTTDFFMPIVNDPYDFGRIASVNAISDLYAMGGTPVLAISILGWPVNKINPDIAQKVIEGSRAVCIEAGIPLAGGHSIDSPEPIFGLAVSGLVPILNLKRNDTAKDGDLLFLTKPLGTGILATAIKKGIISAEDERNVIEVMCRLNRVGAELGKIKGVNALTDVTGFGLLGHLIEMCEGSGTTAEIQYKDIPFMKGLEPYIAKSAFPGNTARNWSSYENKVHGINGDEYITLSDPQTSGGLLVAVAPWSVGEFMKIILQAGLQDVASKPIGVMKKKNDFVVEVVV